MILTDQKTAPKTLHLLTCSVDKVGTVNTKKHCSMTVIGKTRFTCLKSRQKKKKKKKKMSSRNCNVSCKTGSM